MNGPPLFVAALSAPLTGVSLRRPTVLHAVELGEIVRAWPNKTATAPCGAKHLRLIRSGDTLSLWPPRVDSLPEASTRCRECHELTGRKRPRSQFVKAAS